MFFRRLNWNIVGWFRTVSAISYIIIALGLGAMIYHGFQGGHGFQVKNMLRLGLTFTGGTEVDVAFTQPVTTDQVTAALAPLNLSDERINTAGTDGKHFTIETQTSFANNSVPLKDALNKAAPIDPSQLSITAVGPTLGAEYLRDALLALIIALSIQFIYIAFRFGWNYIFGLVTVIALVRDALVMIGIYAIADRPADDAFLAAVLTVIGYSVMDTIVILDRIRENTKLMVGVAYETIVNESIKQTMTRSFNTLATVIITLVALLALGGASLKNFAFALLVGICSGGYHSIFFSAPLVLNFRKRQLEAAARRRKASLAAPGAAPARVDASGKASRDDIVAARRARRAQQKTSARAPQTSPARYRRKREEGAPASVDTMEAVDPLDAQVSGLHDEAYDAGHETISLNLEGFEAPAPEHEPDGAHQE
ncbi:MAG TPA: protein translocase subunit SecF [Candidatus Acidoferrum sp.]|nr:protein translocase subunit SecF [Candidatus Acidoferrum sp.]